MIVWKWTIFWISEDTNEGDGEQENDPNEEKAEIKEFLRKVRSHGSFKIIIGDESHESPIPVSKNPIRRVQNT